MKKTLQEVREYINEGVYDPGIFKAFFLAGGPGSGKTFVVLLPLVAWNHFSSAKQTGSLGSASPRQ